MRDCQSPRLFTRKYLLRVAIINLLAATGAVLLSAWFGKIVGPVDLRTTIIDGLIYAYVIGSIGAFFLPFVGRAVATKGVLVKIGAIGSGIVVMTVVGCAAAGAILAAIGMMTAPEAIRSFIPVVRFSVVIALVAGLGAFFFESTRSRLEETKVELRERQLAEERALKLAAEARLSSLESRIHPHFLFNTLNSIAALIHDDPNRAEEIVGRLAALLRFSLDANQRRLVTLAEELKIIRDYLEIEKARFGSRLRYFVAVPDGLRDLQVPAMSVQSLVENSVKHAVAPKREGGDIHVEAYGGKGELVVEVRDTGAGFDLSTAPEGHGIDNLRARLQALYGARARIEGGNGVIRLVIPETV